MTVPTKKSLTCLAVLAFVSSVSLAARQEVTLRYVWPKDETLRYRVTQQTTSTISGLPGGMADVTLDQTTTQIIRSIAKDVAADGTTTIEQVIESVKMDMNTPMGKVAYDSAQPKPATNPMEDMMSRMFGGMVNAPYTITLAPNGAVQKVEGVSKLAEKIFSNIPSNPQADQMLGGLKAALSDEGMKGTLAQGFAQMPQTPLKTGDTWKGSFETPNPAVGKMVFGYTSTLQAVENQIATIQTKLTITQDASVASAMPMGLKVTLGSASGDADLSFDTGKGRVQKSVSRFLMPVTMSGSAPDGTSINMSSNAKTTVTMELVQ
jgi:uncharacterized protein DUF6263